MRVTFVQPPPYSSNRPSYALSLLREIAESAGHQATVVYANLGFVAALGEPDYDLLADSPFTTKMIGDVPFADYLNGPGSVAACLDRIRSEGALDSEALQALRTSIVAVERAAAMVPSFLEETCATIAASRPDLIGVSAIFNIVPALALVRALKQRLPEIPVVLGGSHCEGVMGAAIHRAFSDVDYVANGPGEQTVVGLLSHLESGTPAIADVPHLIWRSGRESVVNNDAVGVVDLNQQPFVNFDDWYAQRAHLLPDAKSPVSLPIETSRGCWYGAKKHCTFCGLNGLSMSFRSKTPERALAEFRALARYGPAEISATDNILDTAYFKSVLPVLAAEKFGTQIFYEVKANLSESDLVMLAAANVRRIQPGIESLSTPVLRLMQKGVGTYQNLRLLSLSLKHGISVGWNLLVGFPGESDGDYQQMLALIPKVAHLMPPAGFGQVRADRFSPMFIRPADHGIANLRVSEIFRELLGKSFAGDENLLSDAAYYFDHDAVGPTVRPDTLQRLSASVADWKSGFGERCLGVVYEANRAWIADTRFDEGRYYLLDEHETAVLRACEKSISVARLVETVQGDVPNVADLIRELVYRDLVVEVDRRLVSLPVDLTDDVPCDFSGALIHDLIPLVYRRRVNGLRLVDERLEEVVGSERDQTASLAEEASA